MGGGTADDTPPGAAAGNRARIGVLVCDDHEVLRHGLRTVLSRAPDVTVLGEAGGPDEALAMATRMRPDVALVGLGARGPVVHGLVGALTALGIPVLLLGDAVPSSSDFIDVLRAGARGYVTTTRRPEGLVEGVRAVAHGGTVLDGAVTGNLLHHLNVSGPDGPGGNSLTARQWTVAELVAEGLTNAEIAERLRVSRATVKGHITVALRRLGLRDRTQLAIHVHRTGHSAGSSRELRRRHAP